MSISNTLTRPKLDSNTYNLILYTLVMQMDLSQIARN